MAIFQGNFGLALHQNGLIFIWPVLFYLFFSVRKVSTRLSILVLVGIFVITLIFTVVRNIPNSPLAPI